MAILLFANNAAATLQNSIGSGGTTLVLAPGTGAAFPNPGAGQYFLGTFIDAATGLLNEIVKVTARSGDTLTIVRAQEGTAAQNWNSGDFFKNFWTAGSAAAMLQQGQQQQQATNYAVDTGSVNSLAITLSPAPSSMTTLVGAPIRVLVANTTTVANPTLNVNGLGAQNIVIMNSTGSANPGVGSFAAGQVVELVWDGSNFQYWGRLAAATTTQVQTGTDNVQPVTSLALANGFPFVSGSTGGYQKFPNGVLIQWGQITTASGTGENFTFGVAFPNACVAISAGSGLSSDSYLTVTDIRPQSSSQLHVNVGKLTGSGVPPAVAGQLIYWMAIGY